MWFKARVVILAIGASAGFVYPFLTKGEFQALGSMEVGFIIVGMLLGLLLMPPMLLGVIGIQAINPFSAPVWTRPSWETNFLNLGDPLHFFHCGGWCFIATGPGMILMAPFTHWLNAVWGIMVIVGGIELLWAVRLCEKVYRRKFPDVPSTMTALPGANVNAGLPSAREDHVGS
jgi:hypothetical protein